MTCYYPQLLYEDKEWVYYNNVTNGEQKKPLYRLRYVSDTSLNPGAKYDLQLYDSFEYNNDEALTILSWVTGSTFSLKGKYTDVDIPSDFWASGLPEASYNVAKLHERSDVTSLTFSGSPSFATVETCEDSDLSPTKYYWYDVLTNTHKVAYVKDNVYTENGMGIQAVNLCENIDGSGFQVKWVPGIGPVGDDYASTLVYPIYDLPEGCEPTRLLYVRDIKTNEILWGDPSLDKDYQSVGETLADNQPTGYTVYTAQGICLMREGSRSAYEALPAGLYIVNGKKLIKK